MAFELILKNKKIYIYDLVLENKQKSFKIHRQCIRSPVQDAYTAVTGLFSWF